MPLDKMNPAAANSGAQEENTDTQYTPHTAPSPSLQVQKFNNVPHELRVLKQWVNWREEKKKGQAKLSKVPYTPGTIKHADPTDPNTLGTYEDAVASVIADSIFGIGFVFTDNDPYAGIDFDYTDDPELFAHHLHWCERLNSYSERSPSGKGLHVIVMGSVAKGINSRTHKMEVYSSGRYFTFTGDVYRNAPIEPRPFELAALYAELSAARAVSATNEAPDEPETRSDEAILESMFNAANGDRYRPLWVGEWQQRYPSQSEADFACIEGLYFHSHSHAQTERLFKQSGLYRPTKRGDYIGRMIRKLSGRPALPDSVVTFGQQFAATMAAGGQDAAPPSFPHPTTGTPPVNAPGSNSPPPADALVIHRVSDVAAVSLHWLWPQRFALGKVSLIAGDPGLGKSQLTAFLAAMVTTGSAWPNGEGVAPQGEVIMLSCEDDLADTIRPRLEAAGADIDRVHVISAIATGNGSRRSFNLTHDVAKLEKALQQLEGRTRLVVIDPITAYMGGKIDNNGATEVRDVLNPVQDLAARYGVAIVCVTHPPKNAGNGKAINSIIGSQAYVAATRAAWMVTRDQDNENRRLFVQVKNNLGTAKGLAFTVQSRNVPTGNAPYIVFEHGYVEISADEALGGAAQTAGLGRNKMDRAKAFLHHELANGPVDHSVLMQRAEPHALTERTLQRAAKDMGVLKSKKGLHDGWEWGFPVSRQQINELFAPFNLPPMEH